MDTWVQMQQMYRDMTGTFRFEEPGKALTNVQTRSREDVSLLTSDRRSSGTLTSTGPRSSMWKEHFENPPVYSALKDSTFLGMLEPPDGGTVAWLQVLASFMINFNNWGLINSFGTYQEFYETDLLSHRTPSQIAWIGTLQPSLLLILGAVSGALFDMGYFNGILRSASITMVFATMMLSLSKQYYQILLCQGFLTGICMGFLYIPSIATIPLYFKKRRGLALGLALSGGSVGGVIYPIVFRRLLVEVGFGWATRVIGFMMLALLLGANVIIRPNNTKKPARKIFDLTGVKEVPFALLMVYAFLIFCAYLVPFFLAPTYASLKLGASEDLSFYLVAVLNAAQFFGRLTSGGLADRFGGEIMIAAASIIIGIIGFAWIAVHNIGGFVVLLIVHGYTSGVIATLPAVIIPYLCPSLSVLGSRMGMAYAASGFGALVSVPIATAASKISPGKVDILGAQLWMGITALVSVAFLVPGGIVAYKRRMAVSVAQTGKT